HAITTADVNVDNIISCYRKYMEFVVGAVPGKKEYLANMEAKMLDPQFLANFLAILRTPSPAPKLTKNRIYSSIIRCL
ncbi:MAG: nucleotidyl transferase AbiEii/AbiGii toxin family protein, partial [Bacteroidales bacterium]|nr:hypothetical protein [Synergistaceae bacterium]MDD3105791.1 nucleotidyl transferase AbiEii/AbiGii toxin family protein [Bacteroidales bacterium]